MTRSAMDDHTVDRVALATAHRLAEKFGSTLEADVLSELHAHDRSQRLDQYVDPISLASLIVSAATLAWTIYQDIHKKTPQPPREPIEQRLRTELPANDSTARHHDLILDVVVDEIINEADDSQEG